MFNNKKTDSKLHGKKNEVVGGVKQSFGKLFWNYSLRNRGLAQKHHGKMEQNMARTKGYSNGIKHSTKGSWKSWWGKRFGNPRMMAQGKSHSIKGNVLKGIHS